MYIGFAKKFNSSFKELCLFLGAVPCKQMHAFQVIFGWCLRSISSFDKATTRSRVLRTCFTKGRQHAHLAALAPFFGESWTGRAGHGKLLARFTAMTGFTNAGA